MVPLVLETHPHLMNTQSLRVSGALHVPPVLPLGRGWGEGWRVTRASAESVLSSLSQAAWGEHMTVSHVILLKN